MNSEFKDLLSKKNENYQVSEKYDVSFNIKKMRIYRIIYIFDFLFIYVRLKYGCI